MNIIALIPIFHNILFVLLSRYVYKHNFKNQTIMSLEKIGINAGLIWSVIENGELNVKAVKKATKLAEKDLNLALGWLAREGKIKFNEVESEVFVSLA